MHSSNLTTKKIKSSIKHYQKKLTAAVQARGQDADIGDKRSGEQDSTHKGVYLNIDPLIIRPTLQEALETLDTVSEAADPPAQGGMEYIEEARIVVTIESIRTAIVRMEKAGRGSVPWDDDEQIETV